MRRLGLLLAAVLLTSTSLMAASEGGCSAEFHSCSDDLMMQGPYEDPQSTGPNSCTAYRRLMQACRECVRQYDENGQPTAVKVCARVERTSSCKCGPPNAASCSFGEGVCTYEP